ncbi:MAG: extracellular solute-binding protein, partial [Pikeienuella sp.]
MRLTRREFTATVLAAAIAPTPGFTSGAVHRSHGASLIGDLKYPADFQNFEYVNPNAPKGGTAREATLSNFDSFNPFIVKGDSPQGIGAIFDTLMTPSADRSSEEYGLLAEWIEHPDDYSWVSFKLRDEARWHDGQPITVEDVIFSLDILVTEGHPQYRFYYQNVVGGTDLGNRVVRFDFDVKNNRELPHIMGQLRILPKHWWAGREFSETSLEPMLGSGPYQIGEFEPGRFIEYERVENYWGANLAVNRGQNNFDRLRYEIFLDSSAAFEGFKSGEFDFRDENSAKIWATQYDFPAAQDGRVKLDKVALQRPQRSQILAMNLRRDKFKDRRIREALSLAYDFETLNKTVYFDQYSRVSSYFQGSPSLTPTGSPQGAELAMLEALRGQVPEEVFGPAYEPPKTKGDGRNRRQMRKAAKLLRQAGCEIRDGELFL